MNVGVNGDVIFKAEARFTANTVGSGDGGAMCNQGIVVFKKKSFFISNVSGKIFGVPGNAKAFNLIDF